MGTAQEKRRYCPSNIALQLVSMVLMHNSNTCMGCVYEVISKRVRHLIITIHSLTCKYHNHRIVPNDRLTLQGVSLARPPAAALKRASLLTRHSEQTLERRSNLHDKPINNRMRA